MPLAPLLPGDFTLPEAAARYVTRVHRLEAGDCLAMLLDRPVVFANRSRHAARYLVVISAETPGLGRRA